ncbi:DUF6271 family protein [Streptomyces sp. NPDC057702]|uniref:DUF6271 family protein n=1 Tax=unclassified Streptomyces TaxID=2593676 RepID=UPI003699D31D
MRAICLTLPTNRPSVPMVTALCAEAAYAVRHFPVEVHVLVLDSADPTARAAHAEALASVREVPGVVLHHLDEDAQRAFLREVIQRAGVPKPELTLDLMLPADVSYGACTNRAFLIGAALGCDSVHRRDSDSSYQELAGEPVYPIHHELTSIGEVAREAARRVDATDLEAAYLERPVVLVGASFVGELSVDISEIRQLDPDVYHDVVGLWAPTHWSAEQKRELVDESFTGAGTEPFTADHALLTVVDPMRLDMCNISFHQVHEAVPLPPATNTIGSDYFLMHLVHDAALPGVLHNRHIVNFYTTERRTDAGFAAYQLRFTKFFLSMLYLNAVYDAMAEAGPALLDADHQVNAERVSALVWDSTRLPVTENEERLDVLERSYRTLGGRYATFAQTLAPRRQHLLDEARQDMEDFARLIDTWRPLVRASRTVRVHPLHR